MNMTVCSIPTLGNYFSRILLKTFEVNLSRIMIQLVKTICTISLAFSFLFSVKSKDVSWLWTGGTLCTMIPQHWMIRIMSIYNSWLILRRIKPSVSSHSGCNFQLPIGIATFHFLKFSHIGSEFIAALHLLMTSRAVFLFLALCCLYTTDT